MDTDLPSPVTGLPFSAPIRRSAFANNPYPQPDPGAGLRIPELYCPGRAVAALPDSPEPGRLYGLPAGQDWITVSAQAQKGSLTYRWATRRSGQSGEGSRAQFDTWLSALAGGRAA